MGGVNTVRVEAAVVRMDRDGWVDGDNNGRRGSNMPARCLEGDTLYWMKQRRVES